MCKEVETSGNHWKAKEGVMFFIYTPAITISLASKLGTTNRLILLAIAILSPTVALSVPYLLLFCSSLAWKNIALLSGYSRNPKEAFPMESFYDKLIGLIRLGGFKEG